MKRLAYGIMMILCFTIALTAQPAKDKGTFIESKNPFWDEVTKSSNEFAKKKTDADNRRFIMDFTNMNLPKKSEEFKQQWHNQPLSQGWTGTCWCFSATSFLESEIYRINKKKIKISEIYTVYWEYVEKARRFVQERGNSYFAEGSQANAVPRMWKKYGCVPAEAYSGLRPGQTFHDHHVMADEMTAYLQSVKARNEWNEKQVLETIKAILNYYLGEPPTEVTVDGKTMTPLEYLKDVAKIEPDDYVNLYSMMAYPYYTMATHKVVDNWWMSNDYYNLPLDEYMGALKSAVKKGYTFAIGGDVSEPGYFWQTQVAMVPTFDIPSEYIDENARYFRYTNNTTTDDHGIHLCGYKEIDGKFWFLIKDSGSGSQNGTSRGYYFYHEDYIKLKMMNLMVHRSAVEDYLKKFSK